MSSAVGAASLTPVLTPGTPILPPFHASRLRFNLAAKLNDGP
jgi:hypothetical protein